MMEYYKNILVSYEDHNIENFKYELKRFYNYYNDLIKNYNYYKPIIDYIKNNNIEMNNIDEIIEQEIEQLGKKFKIKSDELILKENIINRLDSKNIKINVIKINNYYKINSYNDIYKTIIFKIINNNEYKLIYNSSTNIKNHDINVIYYGVDLLEIKKMEEDLLDLGLIFVEEIGNIHFKDIYSFNKYNKYYKGINIKKSEIYKNVDEMMEYIINELNKN